MQRVTLAGHKNSKKKKKNGKETTQKQVSKRIKDH
jgi:hypothetical protein